MTPPRGEKRGTERRPAPYPGFGGSGKCFLIDNLLAPRDPPQGNPPARTASPPRTSGPTGGACRAREGPQSTPTLWRSGHAKGAIQQPYAGFQTLASRSPPAFLTFLGGSGPFPAPPAIFPKGPGMALWPPDPGPRPRKGILRRAVFSEEQRKQLERTFRRQKYIGKADRNKLASDLRLKETQVKIWFQNQRMKWRNSKEKEALCGSSPGGEGPPGGDEGREEARERSPPGKVGETSCKLPKTPPPFEPCCKPHPSPHLEPHPKPYPSSVRREHFKTPTMPFTKPSRRDSATWTQEGNSVLTIKQRLFLPAQSTTHP